MTPRRLQKRMAFALKVAVLFACLIATSACNPEKHGTPGVTSAATVVPDAATAEDEGDLELVSARRKLAAARKSIEEIQVEIASYGSNKVLGRPTATIEGELNASEQEIDSLKKQIRELDREHSKLTR